MLRAFALFAALITGVLFADAAPPLDKAITAVESKKVKSSSKFTSFTGKVLGSKVRMRSSADLDSFIISELSKEQYVVVIGEKGDFYAVEAPADLRAYIFRGFVIDNLVEGNHVNIRLSPDREAPVIGHYSTGEPISGSICKDNSKWLEISAPKNTRFFIAKEYVEYAGKPGLKAIHDKRRATVTQLFEATNLLSQSELRKAFHEIDIARIAHGFQTIINEYSDFPLFIAKAATALSAAQEDYLHRKIAFLEARASKMNNGQVADIYEVAYRSDEVLSPTDRMKVWEPLEEALYKSWSSMHHAKSMENFYDNQKLKCQNLSGILEPYRDPVKNKPGDFILRDRDMIVGYIYSTHVNLDEFTGKRVNLMVTSRPNNNFAFPAYYVLDVE
ncbi:MAG: hypothetical protein K1060chlam2_00282 [Chlamydiae bacterium]|nr:hypothetical protein [Chlamydiota bacterium]